jgi:hypothetical protein
MNPSAHCPFVQLAAKDEEIAKLRDTMQERNAALSRCQQRELRERLAKLEHAAEIVLEDLDGRRLDAGTLTAREILRAVLKEVE